ncbi:MAG: hypothetical protein ACQCN4_03285 [Candidatus Bathyarchaeia archaeon]
MVKTTNQKTATAIITASLMLLCLASISLAVAQDYQPPQIPNYNAPPDEQNKLDITIPSEPSNEGEPNTPPTVAPTPEPQPNYEWINLAILIAIPIAGAIGVIVIWTRSKKRKTTPT